MSKPFIFISCGQFTEDEKRLGRQIASMVRTLTGLEPFFAEEVQDLNGLDANILTALHDCVGFITVMHPRGKIERPDKPPLVRGSVWIEQEIAIATYIQRSEKRPLPIIAFKHSLVNREGIRDLLQLNPIEFTHESEVLAALPERLIEWKSLKPSGLRIELSSIPTHSQDGHPIRTLRINVINETSQRFTTYTCEVTLPARILKHWSAHYMTEIPSKTGTDRRYFRFDEAGKGPLSPHSEEQFTLDYCTRCAVDDTGGVPALVAEGVIDAKLWIDNREYRDTKTIKELAEDAARGGNR